MRIKVRIHEEADGGYWAEVPSVPGCATQGDTFEDLLENVSEAVEGCLSIGKGSLTPASLRARLDRTVATKESDE